ncbi:protein argonaute 4A-like [Lycium barbarum]|uniref:protein argonaute 4A-like n=1 Tax=Lycium barbarum TaxID=112863 RepID=UPI00293EF98F|nr:protein argonaute 4A-like [Lycium barbarum]
MCCHTRGGLFMHKKFAYLGNEDLGYRGFHSSYYFTQKGPSLNMDASTRVIAKQQKVMDFIIANASEDHASIDWVKAERMLKGLRIKTMMVRIFAGGISARKSYFEIVDTLSNFVLKKSSPNF